MFDYTHNSYVHFGYNDSEYTLRKVPEDSFFLSYEPCANTPSSFNAELVRAANLIAQSCKKPRWVCLSGGMDSEVTLRAFQMAGLEVNAAILRYSAGANDHDIRYATDYCKKNDINYRVFNLDLEHFYATYLEEYSYIQCPSPQFYPVMWLIEQIVALGGLPIVGNGDSCLKRIECTNNFEFIECEKYFSYYFLMMSKNLQGIPAFLQYTPELFYAFLTAPKVVEYINGRAKAEKLISISKWKHEVYNSFFPIEHRPVYNGFENIESLDQKYRIILEERFPGSNGEFRIPYYELVGHLKEK